MLSQKPLLVTSANGLTDTGETSPASQAALRPHSYHSLWMPGAHESPYMRKRELDRLVFVSVGQTDISKIEGREGC